MRTVWVFYAMRSINVPDVTLTSKYNKWWLCMKWSCVGLFYIEMSTASYTCGSRKLRLLQSVTLNIVSKSISWLQMTFDARERGKTTFYQSSFFANSCCSLNNFYFLSFHVLLLLLSLSLSFVTLQVPLTFHYWSIAFQVTRFWVQVTFNSLKYIAVVYAGFYNFMSCVDLQ